MNLLFEYNIISMRSFDEFEPRPTQQTEDSSREWLRKNYQYLLDLENELKKKTDLCYSDILPTIFDLREKLVKESLKAAPCSFAEILMGCSQKFLGSRSKVHVIIGTAIHDFMERKSFDMAMATARGSSPGVQTPSLPTGQSQPSPYAIQDSMQSRITSTVAGADNHSATSELQSRITSIISRLERVPVHEAIRDLFPQSSSSFQLELAMCIKDSRDVYNLRHIVQKRLPGIHAHISNLIQRGLTIDDALGILLRCNSKLHFQR